MCHSLKTIVEPTLETHKIGIKLAHSNMRQKEIILGTERNGFMKIIVNSPLMRDKIITALEGYKNQDVEFHYVSQQGISVVFEVTGLEGAAAIELTKKIIRSHEFGKVLYFQVVAEKS